LPITLNWGRKDSSATAPFSIFFHCRSLLGLFLKNSPHPFGPEELKGSMVLSRGDIVSSKQVARTGAKFEYTFSSCQHTSFALFQLWKGFITLQRSTEKELSETWAVTTALITSNSIWALSSLSTLNFKILVVLVFQDTGLEEA
jgi:hypothetical protein